MTVKYEVVVEHVIKEGAKFQINPSDAFAGIETGHIEVIELLKYENLPEGNRNTLVEDQLGEEFETEGVIWVGYEYDEYDAKRINMKNVKIYMPAEILGWHISLR
jgi:hypothetical protein